ncbi:hypothetical protein SCLCIDRAFT_47350, partial [Scleroderma citrinum Foug A]
MCPQTHTSDLPSTHDITNYIHNSFVKFISALKERLQGNNIGCISTTTDLWSVDQTKALFMGITAH